MSKIENYLKESLKDFKEIKTFQDYFNSIAKYIFGNVAIVIGDSNSKQIKYYLEEIEFYYNNFSKKDLDSAKNKSEKEKNFINHFSCTYKRNRDAGQLFWHYSGVDICFQSYPEENCYGGILIRSMSKCDGNENNPELIAGPLRCANEIANQSINLNSIPRIEEIKWTTNRIISVDNIGSTVRQGIENTDRYKAELESIRNDGAEKITDFPFFCYYLKRGRNNWKIRVNDKDVNYSSIPENRNGIERSIK
jgi:hypothetical protein